MILPFKGRLLFHTLRTTGPKVYLCYLYFISVELPMTVEIFSMREMGMQIEYPLSDTLGIRFLDFLFLLFFWYLRQGFPV